MHVYTDGSVLVSHGGVEMGQGLHTKMSQVAARALGVPVERVHIGEMATTSVANASPTAASFSADLYGMAIKVGLHVCVCVCVCVCACAYLYISLGVHLCMGMSYTYI